MRQSTALAMISQALIIVLYQPSAARAQFIFAGSTPQGDYLRGLGIELMGEGLFNLNTAQAESINANTMMRWNEYWSSVFKNQKNEYVERQIANRARRQANYEKILQRIRDNPESNDVLKGDALNEILRDLLDPKRNESAFRYAEVPIPVDFVRKIPFKLADKGVTISMARLSPTGKGKWGIAFQGDHCLGERRIYEQAIDHALEEAIEGHIQPGTIEAIERAVDALERRLNDGSLARTDTRYLEGIGQLKEFRNAAEQLKFTKVEQAIGEIDKYAGMNINDLRLFMQKYHLTFGAATTPDERKLYPELYAYLMQQRDTLDAEGVKAKP